VIPQPHLSIQVVNFAAEAPDGWQRLLDHAVAADRAGVDRIAVSDHVVFGDDLSAYAEPAKGGLAGGRQPTGPDGHWLEPLTTLAWLAGQTNRVRLQTGILLAALRRPVVLAKSVATLDVLSGGRLDLGVGVGWQEVEYTAAGLEFADRGRLLDHALEVCEVLWGGTRASYESPELGFEGVYSMPGPVEAAGIPVWVSGTANRRTARRLARFGTGWIPWGDDRADLVAGMARMCVLFDELGLGEVPAEVQGSVPTVREPNGAVDLSATMTGIPDLVAAGVTDCRLALRLPDGLEEATDLLGCAVGAFRSAVGRP